MKFSEDFRNFSSYFISSLCLIIFINTYKKQNVLVNILILNFYCFKIGYLFSAMVLSCNGTLKFCIFVLDFSGSYLCGTICRQPAVGMWLTRLFSENVPHSNRKGRQNRAQCT